MTILNEVDLIRIAGNKKFNPKKKGFIFTGMVTQKARTGARAFLDIDCIVYGKG